MTSRGSVILSVLVACTAFGCMLSNAAPPADAAAPARVQADDQPNIVLVFMDNFGYVEAQCEYARSAFRLGLDLGVSW